MKSDYHCENRDNPHPLWRHTMNVFRTFNGFIRTMALLWGIIFLTALPCRVESADESMFIDGQGNVGIGITSPRAKLDVNGKIRGIGMVPPGAIVMFYGDISKFFDGQGTGLADTSYEGWQLCNGNNGSPDLRGRFVLGAGQGPDLTRRVTGQIGGEETHVLTNPEIPIHDHQATLNVYPPALKSEKIYHAWNSSRTYSYGAQTTPQAVKTTTAGEGKAHNNMPPFYTLAFIMRLP